MASRSIASRLLEVPSLQRQLKHTVLESIAEQFGALDRTQGAVDIDVNYLLMCASVLAQGDDGSCLDASLRIAQHILVTEKSTSDQRMAAGYVLDALTNTTALNLAARLELIQPDFRKGLPLTLQLESVRRRIENSAIGPKGALLFLNRFQQRVRTAFETSRWVSFSAPTSSGKSFLLQHLVERALNSHSADRIVLLVPTRALIRQIDADLRVLLKDVGHDESIEVVSVPRLPNEWESKRFVFVFTQERLFWLLRDAPAEFSIDLVIIDEAHKIADATRGILLEQVLDQLVERSSLGRVLFASPLTSNPEALLRLAPPDVECESIVSEFVAVNQNLLWAQQVKGRPLEWTLECVRDNEVLNVGRFKLNQRPSPASKRLTFVAHTLGAWGTGNLIYANGPADAEKAALQLSDLCPDKESFAADPELQALSELAAKSVHSKYALVATAPHGVGFHYGNMPTLLRAEVERLFATGKLRYLAATSTLLEGVNLATRSVYLRGPTKGRGRPLGEMDFWNLAGRAGRLGKDFQGNIVCVDARDTKVWKQPPPKSRGRYEIRRSLDRVIRNRSQDLLDFISRDAPMKEAKSNPELEYAFSMLVGEHLRWGSLDGSPLADRYGETLLAKLTIECQRAVSTVDLPGEILLRHPGVNPYSQQRLLEFFRSCDDASELLPVLPESDDAVKSYKGIIDVISELLSDESKKRSFPMAIIVVSWLRGYPLSRIIAQSWKYWEKRGKTDRTPKKLADVIRQTMGDVEKYARFEFPKFVGCYLDILRQHLVQLERPQDARDVPNLDLWLEFGTSQETQMSLMMLGLSRISAIAISELITADSLGTKEALDWLKNNDPETLGLPVLVGREIQTLIEQDSQVTS